MGNILRKTKLIDDSGPNERIDKHRAAVDRSRVAPKASDGTPGAIKIVEHGGEARLYVKGSKGWFYLTLGR